MQRNSGNEKEYLVCYSLYELGYTPMENALNKMNFWALTFPTVSENMKVLTKKWLEKCDITSDNKGTFNIVLDNMGKSKRSRASTTADIVVYPAPPALPISFSIKNNNTFLKSPCPHAFPEQARLDESASADFSRKYGLITDDWYHELKTKYGGRFPVKAEKMDHYTRINNLVKSFLITYDAENFVKFILDIEDRDATIEDRDATIENRDATIENQDADSKNKYIVKYNKTTATIYKIDIDMNLYKIVVGNVNDTFLYINLVHKKKKTDPIEIKLRIKNYEGFTRMKSKVLPIKYTVSIRNLEKFKCFSTSAAITNSKNSTLMYDIS